MKKTYMIVVLLLLSQITFAKTYDCTLMSGGAPRFGIQQMKIDFSFAADLRSRFELSLLGVKSNSVFSNYKDAKAVYSHSANVHSGQYIGYKKFTPSIRFPSPQIFHEKLSAIVLLERSDRRSAILALIGTKNSEYYCQ